MICNTPDDKILVDDLADLNPIDWWHKEGICLVGDAAHATTPNMGQGACQAVESAWWLSTFLAEAGTTPEQAFAKYQK